MDQAVLVEALGKHLDALNTVITGAVGLAVITAWAGFQRSDEMSLFGMKLTRRSSFYLLASFFLYVNALAIICFVRIGLIVDGIGKPNIGKAITVLATNSWIFNPYAYFGTSISSLAISNFGYGALIVIWWIGYTALAACRDDYKSFSFNVTILGFLLVGLISMSSINFVFDTITEKAGELDWVLRDSILNQSGPRTFMTFAGIGLGSAVFALAQFFKRAQSSAVAADKSNEPPS